MPVQKLIPKNVQSQAMRDIVMQQQWPEQLLLCAKHVGHGIGFRPKQFGSLIVPGEDEPAVGVMGLLQRAPPIVLEE